MLAFFGFHKIVFSFETFLNKTVENNLINCLKEESEFKCA